MQPTEKPTSAYQRTRILFDYRATPSATKQGAPKRKLLNGLSLQERVKVTFARVSLWLSQLHPSYYKQSHCLLKLVDVESDITKFERETAIQHSLQMRTMSGLGTSDAKRVKWGQQQHQTQQGQFSAPKEREVRTKHYPEFHQNALALVGNKSSKSSGSLIALMHGLKKDQDRNSFYSDARRAIDTICVEVFRSDYPQSFVTQGQGQGNRMKISLCILQEAH